MRSQPHELLLGTRTSSQRRSGLSSACDLQSVEALHAIDNARRDGSALLFAAYRCMPAPGLLTHAVSDAAGPRRFLRNQDAMLVSSQSLAWRIAVWRIFKWVSYIFGDNSAVDSKNRRSWLSAQETNKPLIIQSE